MLQFISAALASVLLSVVVPVTTTPQPDNSGRLADRQFLVTTPLGSGYARYFGTSSLDGDPAVTRAIVIVHGVLRDADYYYDTGVIAADAAHALNATLVIAPQFVEREDLSGHTVSPATLYWAGTWPGGSDAVAPAPISTYDVFDAIVARLSDSKRFPKLREIVIAGHSAGGQIVQRYAVVGKSPGLDRGARIPVHLIVSNPSSYFYFTDWRPIPQSHCPDFDEWRYGLKGAPRYVTGTAAQLEARYVTRHVTYLMGTADTDPNEDDLDRSCGGESQGPNRFTRAKFYIAYIGRRHPGGTAQDYAFVENVPHDNRRMFASACGLAAIFGGSRAACAEAGGVGSSSPMAGDDPPAAPPVYPGAVASKRPAGVGFKVPPAQARTYATSDDFAKVRSWYRARLGAVQEVHQPGMEESEDAFLVGQGAGALVVFVQRYQGKTWIIIGPPM